MTAQKLAQRRHQAGAVDRLGEVHVIAGVQHLVAVAGPSYGGYQTFQWAVSYPTFMSGAVAVV